MLQFVDYMYSLIKRAIITWRFHSSLDSSDLFRAQFCRLLPCFFEILLLSHISLKGNDRIMILGTFSGSTLFKWILQTVGRFEERNKFNLLA